MADKPKKPRKILRDGPTVENGRRNMPEKHKRNIQRQKAKNKKK